PDAPPAARPSRPAAARPETHPRSRTQIQPGLIGHPAPRGARSIRDGVPAAAGTSPTIRKSRVGDSGAARQTNIRNQPPVPRTRDECGAAPESQARSIGGSPTTHKQNGAWHATAEPRATQPTQSTHYDRPERVATQTHRNTYAPHYYTQMTHR